MTGHAQPRGIVRTLIDNSFLLVAGAVIALVWANLAHKQAVQAVPEGEVVEQPLETSYTRFVNFDLTTLWASHEDDHAGDDADHTTTPQPGMTTITGIPITPRRVVMVTAVTGTTG